MTIMKTAPVTIRTVIRVPRRAGSILGKPGPQGGVWREGLKELKPPREPNSPASKPTMARRVHCPRRKGWKSWRLVCWKAGAMTSTAEIGKVHLGKNRQEQGTGNDPREQQGKTGQKGTRQRLKPGNSLAGRGFHRAFWS